VVLIEHKQLGRRLPEGKEEWRREMCVGSDQNFFGGGA
jgi:hypothetical protein